MADAINQLQKGRNNMKKLIATTAALVFALGLTITAHAQGAAEKTKTAPAQLQKVNTQDIAQPNTKTEMEKTAPVEGKKVECPVTGKKDKQTAVDNKKMTKEVKTSAVEGKKPGQETSKTEK